MERKKIIVTGIELVLENYMKMLGLYKRIKSRIFGMLAKLKVSKSQKQIMML